MNGDGVVSISDVGLLVKQIWLIPSNLVVGFLHENPQLTTFFEIDCSTGQSYGGAIFSLFVWFITFGIVAFWIAAALENK